MPRAPPPPGPGAVGADARHRPARDARAHARLRSRSTTATSGACFASASATPEPCSPSPCPPSRRPWRPPPSSPTRRTAARRVVPTASSRPAWPDPRRSSARSRSGGSGDLSRGPLTVAGLSRRLAASPSQAAAFLSRTAADGRLGVIGLLTPPNPSLGLRLRRRSLRRLRREPAPAGPPRAYPEALGVRRPQRCPLPGPFDPSARTCSPPTWPGSRSPAPRPTVAVPFGDNWLTLVMSARGALAGSLPQDLPWMIAVARSAAVRRGDAR